MKQRVTPLVIKLDAPHVHVPSIWHECIEIISKYGWGETGQLSLTHRAEIEDKELRVFQGAGSLRDTGFKELDFNTFNEEFSGGYLEGMFRSLPYNIGRFRLIRMRGRTCYSVHRDFTKRVHIPLVTNPQALMIFPAHSFVANLPANGTVYLTDTTVPHTAMNGGLMDRCHLVGSLCEKAIDAKHG